MYKKELGFTFVEIVVITPIVILAIGAFVGAFITLTAEVLVSRVKGQFTYELHDTITKITDDVRLTQSFLAMNSFNPVSPQGVNNDSTAFTNADSTKGASLILSQYATVGNPLTSASGYVFLTNTPHACNSPSLRQNTILEINVVYFIKNNSLWRRVILPANYSSSGCALPWQLPSCAIGSTDAMCKTNDAELVKGVGINDFVVSYYATGSATTVNTQASDPTLNVSARDTVVRSMKAISVSITAKKSVAGQRAEASATRRVDLPD